MMNTTEDLVKSEIENGNLGGKYCRYTDNKIYYIVGVTMFEDDFYWIGINHKREIHFLNCIGKILQVDCGEIDFSVLNYLIKHEPITIVNDVNRYIKSLNNDVLVSKINVNGKLY